MKIVTIFILLTLTTLANAGGISGGGGGTVIPDPAGTQFITQQLNGARTSLLMFFKYLSYNAGDDSVLFEGANNILEKVKQNAFTIETDKPCYDFDGNPNDGSINSKPNTICLSAKTIGEKVSIVTAYPQILALMAHEYSHLMGYDEVAATEFQKKVLYLTKSISETDGFVLGTEFVQEANNAMSRLMHAQAVLLLGNEPAKAYDAIAGADEAVLFPYKYPMRALDKHEAAKVEEIGIRIKNLRMYACVQFETIANEKEMCEYQYKNIFNGADEITASEFSLAYYGNSSFLLLGKIPNLIKNPEKFLNEMQAIQDELHVMTLLIGDQINLRDEVLN